MPLSSNAMQLSPSGLTLVETRDLIDALPSPVALLDRHGCIHSINQAWQERGVDSDSDLHSREIGADYRLICEKAARHADTDAGLFARGLQAVLAGERAAFEMQAPEAVGDELHVFRARVTRLTDSHGPYYLLSREDVSGRTTAVGQA
ncbi:MAG: hypothetical protein ACI8Y8_001816 [Planctomycetota bacterium]